MPITDLKQMQKYYWTWIIHYRENAYRKNREMEENLKLESGWCAHCRGATIVILN
jgi:hypothetical protein